MKAGGGGEGRAGQVKGMRALGVRGAALLGQGHERVGGVFSPEGHQGHDG